jgi:WD40 repeat protein
MLRLALGGDETPDAASTRRTPTGLQSSFFGDYEILEEISRGGMGVVYRARHLTLKRVVALKMIQSSHLMSPEARLRFGMEVAVAAQLNHPNIVSLYESGEFKGTHFFTMRLVEGGNLAHHIKAARPGGGAPELGAPRPLQSQAAIAGLLIKVARAVHHAHQRGILHRDLKPSNILIDPQGEPHVADFGLAKMLARETASTFTDSVLGSPNYMAPEQAAGGRSELTTATDVYGLGAILYEALAGMPPFQAPTPVETIRKVLDEEVVPPRKLRHGIDPDLETICLKCLQKNAAARYQTAEELGDDLERWQKGLPILARHVGPLGAAWRWSRRRPLVAMLGAALVFTLVAIAVGASVAAMHIRRAERQAVAHWRDALINQASVLSLSGRKGTRDECLNLIRKAATLGGPPEFRQRARDQMLAALALTDMAFSPQAPLPPGQAPLALLDPPLERLATITEGTNLIIRRLGDGAELLHVPTGRSPVVQVEAFSPGGRYLALRHQDGLSFWDTADGRLCFATNGPKRLFCFAAHAPQVVLEEWDYGASIRELPSFHRVHQVNGAPDVSVNRAPGWQAMSLSPDGTWLAVARQHEHALELIETASGLTRWRATNTAAITALAWSPARQRLVAASADGWIRFRNWTDGLPTFYHRLPAPARNLALDDTSALLAVACEDRTVRVFPMASSRQVFHTQCDAHHLAFDPEGLRLGTIARGNDLGWLDLSQSTAFHEYVIAPMNTEVSRCEFSPDGRVIASGYPTRIDLRRVADGRGLAKLPVEQLPIFGFDPQGEAILTSDSRGVGRWAMTESQPGRLEIPPPVVVVSGRGWRALAFSADGRRVVAANTSSNTAYVFDRTFTNCLAVLGRHEGVSAVAISPDGRFVATGSSRTRDMHVWDTATGARLPAVATSARSRMDFSGDGRWLLVHGDAFELRDTRSWAPAPPLPFPDDRFMRGASAFSQDGRLLAVIVDQFEVQLFDLELWKPIGLLRPPTGIRLNTLAFNRDGTRLAAGCERGRLHLWSLDEIRQQLAEADLDWDLPAMLRVRPREAQAVQINLIP